MPLIKRLRDEPDDYGIRGASKQLKFSQLNDQSVKSNSLPRLRFSSCNVGVQRPQLVNSVVTPPTPHQSPLSQLRTYEEWSTGRSHIKPEPDYIKIESDEDAMSVDIISISDDDDAVPSPSTFSLSNLPQGNPALASYLSMLSKINHPDERTRQLSDPRSSLCEPFLEAIPVIVPMGNHWVELCCPICKCSAASDGEWFKGVEGIRRHLIFDHDAPDWAAGHYGRLLRLYIKPRVHLISRRKIRAYIVCKPDDVPPGLRIKVPRIPFSGNIMPASRHRHPLYSASPLLNVPELTIGRKVSVTVRPKAARRVARRARPQEQQSETGANKVPLGPRKFKIVRETRLPDVDDDGFVWL